MYVSEMSHLDQFCRTTPHIHVCQNSLPTTPSRKIPKEAPKKINSGTVNVPRFKIIKFVQNKGILFL